jgi:hypothetical protein
VRGFVLVLALAFIGILGALTAVDFAQQGVTILNVLSVLIMLLFIVAIAGSLLQRPRP